MKSLLLIFVGLVLVINCARADVFDEVNKNIAEVKKDVKGSVTKIDNEVNVIIQQNQKFLDANKASALEASKIKITSEINLINTIATKKPACLTPFQTEVNGVLAKSTAEITTLFTNTAVALKNTKITISSHFTSMSGLENDINRGAVDCMNANTPIDYMFCVTKILIDVYMKLTLAENKAKPIVGQIENEAETVRKSVVPFIEYAISSNVSRLQVIRQKVATCIAG